MNKKQTKIKTEFYMAPQMNAFGISVRSMILVGSNEYSNTVNGSWDTESED